MEHRQNCQRKMDSEMRRNGIHLQYILKFDKFKKNYRAIVCQRKNSHLTFSILLKDHRKLYMFRVSNTNLIILLFRRISIPKFLEDVKDVSRILPCELNKNESIEEKARSGTVDSHEARTPMVAIAENAEINNIPLNVTQVQAPVDKTYIKEEQITPNDNEERSYQNQQESELRAEDDMVNGEVCF
jgi:hypothetical protein